MIIETKFSVGDEVWFMHDNATKESTVRSFKINANGHGDVDIVYEIDAGGPFTSMGTWVELYEHSVFPTKEELIRSL